MCTLEGHALSGSRRLQDRFCGGFRQHKKRAGQSDWRIKFGTSF
jgi:hypothetical protein